MFSRRHRLSPQEVRDTLRRGKPFHSQYATLRVGTRSTIEAPWGATVVAGGRVSKQAVRRNYYRRLSREVIKEVLTGAEPGMSLVLILKPAVKEASPQQLREALSFLLRQAFTGTQH